MPGSSCKFSPKTPSARCFRQMQTGEADLMSNLNFTEERAEYMYLLPYNERIPESLYLKSSDRRLILSFGQLEFSSVWRLYAITLITLV